MSRLLARLGEFFLFFSGPLVALVTTPILARALGPENRGELGVTLTVVAACATVGALGMPQVLLAELRTHAASRLMFHLAFIGSLAAGVAAYGASIALGLPWTLGLVAAAGVPALVLPMMWTSIAIHSDRTPRIAVSQALAAGLRLSGIVVLAWVALLNVNSAAIVQLLVPLAAAAILLAPLTPKVRFASPNTGVRALLAAGFPVVGFGILTFVTLRADLVVLQVTSTSHQVGIYAAAVALTQASLSASAFFKNRIQAALSQGHRLSETRRYLLTLGGLCAAGIAGTALFAQPLCDALFGSEFDGVVPVIKILAVAAGAQMFLDVGQGVLIVRGYRRQLLLVACIGACVTAVSLAVLTVPLGAVGAATAATAGATAAAATSFLLGGMADRRARRLSGTQPG